ncbi:hypothetical protein ACPA54_15190 [Uniformispora flossi]|uniref:hypothetical protein n=1 Tax=Uniformispora flossi TaxID=3390723 RepID=UPI003C2CF739
MRNHPQGRAPLRVTGPLVSHGMQVHKASSYGEWTNAHGVIFTDYTTACGHTGTLSGGSPSNIRPSGFAQNGELCKACWG